MHNNYNLAGSASAGNISASKIYIDNAWVYEDKRAAKPQPKPTLCISSSLQVPIPLTIFNICRFGETSEITPGIHYIIAERHIREEVIKECGWRLQSQEAAELLEIIQANTENIRIGLADGEPEMIAALTFYWSDEFKSAVWAQLTDEEVQAINLLSADSQ